MPIPVSSAPTAATIRALHDTTELIVLRVEPERMQNFVALAFDLVSQWRACRDCPASHQRACHFHRSSIIYSQCLSLHERQPNSVSSATSIQANCHREQLHCYKSTRKNEHQNKLRTLKTATNHSFAPLHNRINSRRIHMSHEQQCSNVPRTTIE